MAERKARVPKKFAGKLPVWLTDKPLHDLAKKHARAEKRSLSALTEQALRNYLSRMTVLDEIDKRMPGNEELTQVTRERIAGVSDDIAVQAMRDPKRSVRARRVSAKEVAAGLGAELVAKVKRGAHKGGFIEAGARALGTVIDAGKSVLPAGKQCCRRSECRHAKARHSPTKSGQLRCDVAGCNCARYME